MEKEEYEKLQKEDPNALMMAIILEGMALMRKSPGFAEKVRKNYKEIRKRMKNLKKQGKA